MQGKKPSVNNILDRLLLGFVLFFVTGVSPAIVRGQALSGPTVELTGHVLDVLPAANKLPKLAASADEPITLTLMLHWSDRTGFNAYARDFEDPTSPNYRKTLSREELTARFGPTQEAYDAV